MESFTNVSHSSGSYPIYVGRGILRELGAIVGSVPSVLITSKTVDPLYGSVVRDAIPGLRGTSIIDDAESAKTLATVESVVTQMLALGLKRDAVAIVLGGGVVGDTGGFAASIYLRGIALIHVPTTLLAQVDSSIGGKLAVNLAAGKNLVGSFYPPKAVVSDIAALDTLPRRELLSGIFEALKGGVIGDRGLFELLEESTSATLDDVVRRAIAVKVTIVSEDEREGDRRRLLNYGHTLGHGLEAALGYRHLTHGEAVAWGMIAANAIAVRRGLLSRETSERIGRAILAYAPERPPAVDRQAVLDAVEHDKKFRSGMRVMVLPREIGECVVVADISQAEIELGLRAAGA
ncbi:MAG TPA: 3-dehydroquinate synthase, partial [Thermoanaerobaculia bacterium]